MPTVSPLGEAAKRDAAIAAFFTVATELLTICVPLVKAAVASQLPPQYVRKAN